MSRRSSIFRRLAKRYRAHRQLFQLAFILLAAAAVIAGVFLGVNVLERDASPGAEADAEVALPPVVPPAERVYTLTATNGLRASLTDIVDQVIVAYGGRETIEQITALSRFGTAQAADSEDSLKVGYFWKAPHFTRYSIRNGRTEQQFISDGTHVWRSLLRSERVVRVDSIGSPHRERFLRNLAMSDPSPLAILDIDQLTLKPSEVVDGRPCHVLARQHPDFVETLWFDQANFLCVRRSRDDGDLSAEWGKTRIDYRDFREVDGVVMPFAQTTYVDGNPSLIFQTEELALNPGMLSSIFAPPEAVSQE